MVVYICTVAPKFQSGPLSYRYVVPFSVGPTVKWSTGHVLDGFCQNESKKCFDKNLMMDITVVAAGKYTKLSVWGDGVRRTVTARVTF